jgi:NAD(P)-dependent dehydrogenase (short-subunit alcohol dehydrogenase family)
MFQLDGRVAVITGGAGGIGLAVADRFLSAGARVVLADINPDVAERAVAERAGQADRMLPVGVDVAAQDGVASLVGRTLEAFDRIDILVNNAGVMGRVAPLWELTEEDWNRVLAVDLTSVFLCCRAVLPLMRAQQSGCIVSVASIAGKEGTPLLVPYSVAKAGIIALTKALAKEVVGDGIRVNCVAPGAASTRFLEQLPPDAVETMLKKVPLGRLGTAEEIAGVIHFLACDDASYVTAQCYDVSGGRATY